VLTGVKGMAINLLHLYGTKNSTMKKIIVPVDFSATSTNAAEFAGNLAIFYGAEIFLYHAYQMPVAMGEIAYPVFNAKEMQLAAENELHLLREATLLKLRSKISISCKAEMEVLTDGLKAYCETLQPDLVVIGLSGKDALTKLIVGSNTIKLVHELSFPVLVVPPKAAFTPVRRIGFACDYKEIEENTPVALMKKVLKDFNAELHVVNVDFEDKHFTPDMVHESISIRELFKDVHPVFAMIEAEEVTAGLSDYANKAGLDWIITIPKKHSLLKKIFNRSQSKDLLYHTHLPVLCLHN
jgi:nucleotide-binding universal stress UspA family protein